MGPPTGRCSDVLPGAMKNQVVQRYNSSELRMTIVYRPWWILMAWMLIRATKITVPIDSTPWMLNDFMSWIALRSPSDSRWKRTTDGQFGSLGSWSMTVPQRRWNLLTDLVMWVMCNISWHGFLDWIHHLKENVIWRWKTCLNPIQ